MSKEEKNVTVLCETLMSLICDNFIKSGHVANLIKKNSLDSTGSMGFGCPPGLINNLHKMIDMSRLVQNNIEYARKGFEGGETE